MKKPRGLIVQDNTGGAVSVFALKERRQMRAITGFARSRSSIASKKMTAMTTAVTLLTNALPSGLRKRNLD